MSIDERLEALTMNVELIAGIVKDQHQSLEVLGREVSSLRDSVSMLASMTDKILGRVRDHDERIDRLERT